MAELHRLKRFAGRTAIITGGSRGIGAGIAKVLAREGGNIIICGHAAHAHLGRALAAKMPALTYVEEASDLCKPDACAALVNAAISKFGRVDLVVNNVRQHKSVTPPAGLVFIETIESIENES